MPLLWLINNCSLGYASYRYYHADPGVGLIFYMLYWGFVGLARRRFVHFHRLDESIKFFYGALASLMAAGYYFCADKLAGSIALVVVIWNTYATILVTVMAWMDRPRPKRA
eukprot:GHVO01065314.1.p2 GENE.GHVO01065314.1~~GHVO01065314.1.p2  ORF type:complete len:111 (-),score=2.71 GHVO01065314.1:128-460(-)